LRKAGLGLWGIVGDNKAADSIEDTAVELSDLPNYIAEFSAMMKRHNQERFITLMPALGIALATCFKLKRKEGISLEA
jgi:hypothetical protein